MGKSHGNVVSAFGWKFFDKMSIQLGHFLVSLVLARLLSPNEYGVIALVMVFISLATTFIQAGFNTALIQKNEATCDDYISVLFFSVSFAIFLYLLIYLYAEKLENFYNIVDFSKIIRVTALVLIPGAINSVQIAHLTRELKFDVLAKSNLVSMLFSAIVGIIMAVSGCGVWALVAQQLLTQSVSCVVTFIITKWYPIGRISIKSLKNMIPFGAKILASNLMVTFFMNMRSMLIGKMYTSDSLGYFNRGKQFPQVAMDGINATIQSVVLPVYARKQDDKSKVIDMLRNTIRISNFIIFPLLVGLACVAEPMIRLVLTEKWLLCVPFLRVFAFTYMCQPVQIATSQVYIALGDSKTPLILEIFRKTIEVGLLFISLKYGVYAIALSTLASGLLSIIISFVPNKVKINYSIKSQLSDILPPLILSGLMGVVVLFVGNFASNVILKLVVQIVSGMVFYTSVAKLLKFKAMGILLNILSNTLKIKRKNSM